MQPARGLDDELGRGPAGGTPLRLEEPASGEVVAALVADLAAELDDAAGG